MKLMDERFLDFDDESREIFLFILLLPQPVSLDALCAITDYSPVKILQLFEKLVKSRILIRDTAKGAGYYSLTDRDGGEKLLHSFADKTVFQAAEQAIESIANHFPDNKTQWLHIAHIYQISGLPVAHFTELIKAAHCCVAMSRSAEAAIYYSMALSGLEMAVLSEADKGNYIDAAIGICTCRSNALSPNIQEGYVSRALMFCAGDVNPERQIKLRVLLARAFTKSGKYEEAANQLDQAWQLVTREDVSSDLRLLVALANSELLFWQGLIDRAIERYEAAIENYESLPNDLETLRIYVSQGWIYGIAGETARGLGLSESVRRKARELNAPDLERYATLAQVFMLSDAGRIDEAEAALAEIFKTDEAQLDHFILWPGNGKRAYFAYCRGEYEKAFFYQNQAYEHSLALAFPHHRGPDNLEYMLGLEKRGFVHPYWNFQSEVQRLLSWPDIFMQGVALRYRALKAFRENGPFENVEADLKKSITLLSRSGARIELAHAWVLMARLRIRQRRMPSAEKLLKNAWEIFAKVNPNLFPDDLKAYLDPSAKHALWLDSLLRISVAIGTLRSRDVLLKEIINQAMRLAGAERGAIFLKTARGNDLAASRTIEKDEIFSEDFASVMGIVNQVASSGTEFVENESQQQGPDGSYTTKGWLGCFPVRLKGRILGVIFIDCRLARMELQENEVSLLRLICNQAAVALENLETLDEIIDLNTHLQAETQFYRTTHKLQMIGQAESFKQMLKLIDDVAKSDTTVMITGETGVGKELVAQAIHQSSDRCDGPFIAVNVVSLSPELIASELFGHERGAFTGATQTRKGRFELASEGTLFLDDIDAFPLDLQAKMLRVLETKAFERVGGTKTLNTRFRLIAASNRRIEELVGQGLFRSDFYFRLNVFPIAIPPLRERQEDIPVFAQYFMEMFSRKFAKQVCRISKTDLQRLVDYPWPGNVRELRHVIERAVLLSSAERLEIPPLNTGTSAVVEEENDQSMTLEEMEAQYIVRILAKCHGKVSGSGGAAELLGVKPTTLYSKMKRLGIRKNGYQQN